MNVYRSQGWMWADACAMLDEAERRHRQFFRLLAGAQRAPAWEPPVDVFASGAELQVVVALPGASPDDVVVQLAPTGLQIETTVAPPSLPAGLQLVRLEIPYGRMRRSIDLPPGRYQLIGRRHEHGCLHLHLARVSP